MKNQRTNATKHQRTRFMRRCIELAFKAYGQTSPNPMVGAVIVKNGEIISEGYHKKAGLPHAEINALRKAGKRAKGADLYVNLEPCCYFGRTPPCTDTIIKAGIKRVIYGMKDPNPKVAGKGLKILKKVGVKIVGTVIENSCKKLNLPFIKWITTGLPYVTVKIAVTLDGKIADYKGDSKWISNDTARRYAHWLRAGADIVMVGTETARKDNPRLNVRLPGYKGKHPLPIVVSLRVPKGRGNLRRRVDLKKLFKELGAAGFQSILVEGGGQLHTELIKKHLVDYMIVVVCPKILGNRARPWINDLGKMPVDKSVLFKLENSFMLDDNIILEGIID